MMITMAKKKSGTLRPTLESTTPAVRSPGVTVELVPGGVSVGGREIRKSICYVIVLLCYNLYYFFFVYNNLANGKET